MFHVVLVEPQIPANTGNIIRLCANVGASLHLVEPLGFDMDDSSLKRAGLDYHEYVDVRIHPDWVSCRDAVVAQAASGAFGFSSGADRAFSAATFGPDPAFVFGGEASGFGADVRADLADSLLRVPMRPNNRSLNLANTVSIVLYEAWRQQGYEGADLEPSQPTPGRPGVSGR